MRAELEVYSGLPNPSWALTAEQVTELLARIQTLPHTAAAIAAPGLGYRGVVVFGEESAGFDTLTVFAGVAVLLAASHEETYRDDGRALERWLVGTGTGRVEGSLYNAICKEIDRT